MAKYLDDVLIFFGCILLLAGVYTVLPVATWFVAGAMFIAAGILLGIGGSTK